MARGRGDRLPKETWEDIRARYENTNDKLRKIAKDYGIALISLQRKIERKKWNRITYSERNIDKLDIISKTLENVSQVSQLSVIMEQNIDTPSMIPEVVKTIQEKIEEIKRDLEDYSNKVSRLNVMNVNDLLEIKDIETRIELASKMGIKAGDNVAIAKNAIEALESKLHQEEDTKKSEGATIYVIE